MPSSSPRMMFCAARKAIGPAYGESAGTSGKVTADFLMKMAVTAWLSVIVTLSGFCKVKRMLSTSKPAKRESAPGVAVTLTVEPSGWSVVPVGLTVPEQSANDAKFTSMMQQIMAHHARGRVVITGVFQAVKTNHQVGVLTIDDVVSVKTAD